MSLNILFNMIYKWYCYFIDKLFDWLIKTDTIKATPTYYVADDIVELMHAGFDNRFGDLDTETGLNKLPNLGLIM